MRLGGLFIAILVLVAIVAFPVHTGLADGTANPTRNLPYPDKVERGATFEVLVNFTCPADDFNAVTMRDTAPDGWNVEIEKAWCGADEAVEVGVNQVSIIWNGPYFTPRNFTARYKVTVPCNASVGKYNFSFIYPNHTLIYHIAGSGKIAENIVGEHNVTVINATINFTPTSIHFYGAVNGTNPQSQTMELWSSTPCMLNWNVTDDAVYVDEFNVTHDWLSENPPNGSCTDVSSSVDLSVNSSGMPAGDYFANITINASEANNSVEIVPVILHMSVTDVLQVHVNFIGRDTNNSRWIEPFDVWLLTPGTSQVVWAGNRTTNSTGWFNISDIVVGTYDIAIKNWTCLSEVASNVTVSEGVGAVADFTTREGDANNDDYVVMSDLGCILPAWNTQVGDPEYSVKYDFNRDGYITMSDLGLMLPNWNQHGDLVG